MIIVIILVIVDLGTFMLTRTTVPLTRSELVRLELHLFAFGPFIIVVGDDDDDDVDIDVDVDLNLDLDDYINQEQRIPTCR